MCPPIALVGKLYNNEESHLVSKQQRRVLPKGKSLFLCNELKQQWKNDE